MKTLTFVFNPEKQSPSVQQWLSDHEYAEPEVGCVTEYYHSETRTYCHLTVDLEHFAIRTLHFPGAFRFLETRFNWGNASGWFPQAFGQLFELAGEHGEKLWIADSRNMDMNELRID